MSELLLTQSSFFDDLHLKHLLLDTSFFIDAVTHEEVFNEFAQKCKTAEITLVTITPVLFEFIKGAQSVEEANQRTSLVEQYVDSYYLPVNQKIFEEHIPKLLEQYRQRGAKVSITDLILGALTRQHVTDLCLLTKNSLDFPLDIFALKKYMILKNKKSRTLQVYGVYCYD